MRSIDAVTLVARDQRTAEAFAEANEEDLAGTDVRLSTDAPAAVGLGAVFIWQAWALWRRGSSEEASTQGAIALYKYSISYLSLLFLAVAVDALIVI